MIDPRGRLRNVVGGVLVATRSDLSRLPEVVLPDGFSIRPMDHADPVDVAAWLRVHNDSYGHDWSEAQFRTAVLGHDHIRVTDTYLLVAGHEPVGAASIGVFRRAERIGVGHYLGLAARAQGTGGGGALVAHRYQVLRDRGFVECESQTHVSRVASLRRHFACGFVPKVRLDRWNNPDPANPILRALAQRRLRALYRDWSEGRADLGTPEWGTAASRTTGSRTT